MMASIRNPSPSQPSPGLDRQTADPAQGVADLGAAGWGVEGWNPASTHGGRLRMRTLVTLRWMIIGGELLIFALVGLVLGFDAPYTLCFTVIGASAWVNLLTGVASPGQRLIGGWEAVSQLGFDIGQI